MSSLILSLLFKSPKSSWTINQIYYILMASTEKAMAPHSSTLTWKIPWTEEPGRLQFMGPQRVGHNWVTSLSLFTFTHWRRKGNPLHCSCLENPRGGGAWWAAVYGVAQSQTRLKRLSSSSIGFKLRSVFLKAHVRIKGNDGKHLTKSTSQKSLKALRS